MPLLAPEHRLVCPVSIRQGPWHSEVSTSSLLMATGSKGREDVPAPIPCAWHLAVAVGRQTVTEGS